MDPSFDVLIQCLAVWGFRAMTWAGFRSESCRLSFFPESTRRVVFLVSRSENGVWAVSPNKEIVFVVHFRGRVILLEDSVVRATWFRAWDFSALAGGGGDLGMGFCNCVEHRSFHRVLGRFLSSSTGFETSCFCQGA